MLTPDVLLFGSAFYRGFGYDRPLITLEHYWVVMSPLGDLMPRVGVIEASRENRAAALAFGGIVLVFPGGDYDSYRPTSPRRRHRLHGRTDYVRTAIAAGVPIVPSVSIGGRESQLFGRAVLCRQPGPELTEAATWMDPAIRDAESVHCRLQMMTNALNLWQSSDVAGQLTALSAHPDTAKARANRRADEFARTDT
jgi:hypothetical protein